MNSVITKGFGENQLLIARGFAGARVFRFPARHKIITRGFGNLSLLVTRGFGAFSSPRAGGGGIKKQYYEYDTAIPTLYIRVPRFPKDIRVNVSLLSIDKTRVNAVFERSKAKPIRVYLDGEVEYD